MSGALQPFAPDLWTATQELRFFGVEIGARMTVVGVEGGALFVHSPIAPTPALLEEVRGHGEVAWLVAPNRFHHLSIGEWHREFPRARMLVAPGLREKRPDLTAAEELLPGAPSPVPGLEVECVQGMPLINELAWFHPNSGALILTDLAFNVGPEAPALTRVAYRALGCYDRLGPSIAERLLTRDHEALRASLERILAWPFTRVIVSHGRP